MVENGTTAAFGDRSVWRLVFTEAPMLVTRSIIFINRSCTTNLTVIPLRVGGVADMIVPCILLWS